jgi:hypothetical protein
MAGKLSFLAGFGAGYVLGARAGRDRYEQIATKAQQVWQDPRVQEKAGQAQSLVKDKAGQAGSAAAGKVGDAGAKAAEMVSEKVHDVRSEGSSGTPASTGTTGGTSS